MWRRSNRGCRSHLFVPPFLVELRFHIESMEPLTIQPGTMVSRWTGQEAVGMTQELGKGNLSGDCQEEQAVVEVVWEWADQGKLEAAVGPLASESAFCR